MEETVKNVIFPEEIDFYVKGIRTFRISNIGKSSWLDDHEILIKVHQQTILEAKESREEILKDCLILEGKIKVLVHNAYAILIWRSKILPELLKKGLQPQSTIVLYTIFFHEATLMGLLETLLFHPDACEALEETSLDLIDYSVQGVIRLIAIGQEESTDEEEDREIEKHEKNLQFRIGLRCLSILSFLVDNLDRISLSAVSRLVEIHDTPCLLSEILHLRPWMRSRNQSLEKFINDEWISVAGDEISRVTKPEAHAWFCLREILLNPRLFNSYEVNNFRQREISKCQGLLNEILLDQLPPLADLKQFLVTLTVSKDVGNQKEKKLLLEELPQIKDKFLAEISEEGLEKIVMEQFEAISAADFTEIAGKLSKAFNLEAMEDIIGQESLVQASICKLCGIPATKKCSRCLSVYYCSKECQVKNWESHKPNCKK